MLTNLMLLSIWVGCGYVCILIYQGHSWSLIQRNVANGIYSYDEAVEFITPGWWFGAFVYVLGAVSLVAAIPVYLLSHKQLDPIRPIHLLDRLDKCTYDEIRNYKSEQ